MPISQTQGLAKDSPKMGQIGVALWLPRTMALPAPMLSLSPLRHARATPRSWTCSPRCTLSSRPRARRAFLRLVLRTRTLLLRCATLSAPTVTVWPLSGWLSTSRALTPLRKPLRSLAWLSSWVTSTSVWMVRPLPTLSRRPTSRAWR